MALNDRVILNKPETESADATRSAILDRTLAEVRRHGRRRRLWRCSALATAYVAGGLTVWAAGQLATAGAAADRPTVAANACPVATPPTPAAAVTPVGTSKRPTWPEYIHPREIRERVAEAPLKDRCRLLRTAGDRYLLELDDIAGALACYQQLLELESIVGSSPGAKDTWLLASLRQSDAISPYFTSAEHVQ